MQARRRLLPPALQAWQRIKFFKRRQAEEEARRRGERRAQLVRPLPVLGCCQ